MIRAVFWLVALAASAPVCAQIDVPLPVTLDPKVETILAPLSSMPTIQRADEPLVVELMVDSGTDLATVSATLTPSFGELRTSIALGPPLRVEASVPSRLWVGRTVDRLVYALPAGLTADLYDLEATVPTQGTLSGLSGTDHQRRAVSIVDEYPTQPRVVILADPSVGDPRAVQDATPLQDLPDDFPGGLADYLLGVLDYDPVELVNYVQRSAGNPMSADRWAALAQVIQEVNLVRPDFVLITGDLTFAVHPLAMPYEYDDAWRLLDRLEVPAFLSPGNHDLYDIDEYGADVGINDLEVVDGYALWQKYFGPLNYSVDVGPDLHLTSINTFDWADLSPFPIEDEFDTLAGGQIRAEQLAWLEADLREYRSQNPDGVILTFAHHDPSWIQHTHPWRGEGRLEMRDLLAATRVGAHFSGHTHEDRVARYYQGDIVETNGRPHRGHRVRELHLILRDNTFADGAKSQEQLGAILREPAHGPLFVSTTTASSQLAGEVWGLGGYWGWRLVTLKAVAPTYSFDPIDFGYPATEEFLQRRAERPQNWNPEHAEFGLFSYPSFELSSELLPNGHVRIRSGLLADLPVTSRLRIAAQPGQRVRATGGEIVQLRFANGIAEALVRTTVPAGGETVIALTPANDLAETAAGNTRRNTVHTRGGILDLSLLMCLLLLGGRIRRPGNRHLRTARHDRLFIE